MDDPPSRRRLCRDDVEPDVFCRCPTAGRCPGCGVRLWDDLQIVDDARGLAFLKRKPKIAEKLAPFTYAFFDGPKAFEVVARRMAEVPALQVTLLLNVERRRGDTTAAEHLVRRFTERFWKIDWPGAARPRVFYDPRVLDPDGPGGVLHAKAVVTDDEAVFVMSANLTEAALDRNIELGLLVRDRALAASVSRHFRALIDRALLRPLPAA